MHFISIKEALQVVDLVQFVDDDVTGSIMNVQVYVESCGARNEREELITILLLRVKETNLLFYHEITDQF